MNSILFYLDLIVKETGIAIYLVILLGTWIIVYMVWHKFKKGQSKVKRAHPNIFNAEHFGN